MPDRSQRLHELFIAAIGIADPVAREEYIARMSGDDGALLAELQRLCAAHESEGSTAFAASSPKSAPHMSRSESEEPGDYIGSFKLIELLGEGGFGIVWKAEQHEPVRRVVALKIIKLGMDTREVIARFEQERQALALMDHPGIAKVLDAGTTAAGRPYFVMELVDGVPITKFCDSGKLPVSERLALFVHVCAAIQHAHQKGIIHRDIKPTNILVSRDDAGVPVAKVIDFGIAKATAGKLTDKTLFTEAEQVIGTPAYMSPEQAGLCDQQDIDTRCDIYALGVVLYELLAGRTPFDPRALRAAGFEEMRRIIREEEPPRPSTRLGTLESADSTTIAASRSSELPKLITTIRRELDWVVMKALEKDRARRYDSANGLARDIERFLRNEPVAARPPSSAYRMAKFVRRHRAPVTTAAAIVVAVAAGVIFYIVQIRAERDEVKKSEEKTRLLLAESLAQNAELSVQRGQWKNAIALWDSALAAGHPRPSELRIRRIEALTVEERFAEARAEMAAVDAMALDSAQRAKLAIWKAEDIFMEGRKDEGVALLRAIPPENFAPPDAAYVRGLLSENTPDALAAFREAVTLAPYHHGANARLCSLLLLAGEREEARNRATKASALFPQDYFLHFIVLVSERLSGNEAEVARITETLKSAPPLVREALSVLDDVAATLNEIFTTGQRDPLLTLKIIPRSMAMIARMKNIASGNGMSMEKYGAPYVTNVMTNYYEAAMKHFITQDQPAGLVAIDKAIAHHRVAEFFFLKGMMYMKLRDFPNAASVFEEALMVPAIVPKSHTLCRSAAAVALTLADPKNPEFRKRAHAHYSAMLKVDGVDIIGADNAALAALNVEELDEARAWYALLPADHPDRASTIALVESRTGDVRAALASLKSFPEAQRGDPLYKFARLGVLHRLSTARENAESLQRDALTECLAQIEKLAGSASEAGAKGETLESAVEDSRMAAQLHEALGEFTQAAATLRRARPWLAAWREKDPAAERLPEVAPPFAQVMSRVLLAIAVKATGEKNAAAANASIEEALAVIADISWVEPAPGWVAATKAKLEDERSKARSP